MKLIVVSVVIAFLIPLNLSKPKGEVGLQARETAVLSPVQPVYASGMDELKIIPITPRQHVQEAAIAFGWNSGPEWEALVTLIGHESGWRVDALNPESGACSLFQAFPCSKIKGDWRDPVAASQFGLNYIRDRYGTPSQALAFWYAQTPDHWY